MSPYEDECDHGCRAFTPAWQEEVEDGGVEGLPSETTSPSSQTSNYPAELTYVSSLNSFQLNWNQFNVACLHLQYIITQDFMTSNT